MMLHGYKPSGDGASNSLIAILFAVPCVVGLAWVYQFALRELPTQAKFPVVLVMPVAVGVVAHWSIRLSHVRNKMAGCTSGVLIGVTALAAGHWFAYLLTISGSGVILSFADYVGWRMRNGFIPSPIGQVSPVASSKMPLVTSGFWLVEAVGFVLVSAAAAAVQASSPYCNACRMWANSKLLSFSVLNVSDRAVKQAANATEFNEIINAVTHAATGMNELAFSVTACPVCHGVTAFSVNHKYKADPKKPKSAIKSALLHNDILLNGAQVDSLAGLRAKSESQRERSVTSP